MGITGFPRGRASSAQKVVNLVGSLNNPITKDEIEQEKRKARAESPSDPRFRTESTRTTVKETNEEEEAVDEKGRGKIVNFVYAVSDDGIPQGYTGVARGPKDLSIVRKRAARQRRRLKKGKKLALGVKGKDEDNPLDLTEGASSSSNGQLALSTGNVVSKQNSVSALSSPSFVEIGRNGKDDYRQPYGGVTCSYVFYKLTNDGSSSKDTFAVKHTYAIDPGSRAYSGDLISEYYNDTAEPIQDWKNTQLSTPNMLEWDPLGPVDGSTTVGVSIGTGGANLSWSYTSPALPTNDISQPNNELAKWRQPYRGRSAQSKLGGMKPGSVGQFNQPSNGSGRKEIFSVRSYGKFWDFITGILSANWTTGYKPAYVY